MAFLISSAVLKLGEEAEASRHLTRAIHQNDSLTALQLLRREPGLLQRPLAGGEKKDNALQLCARLGRDEILVQILADSSLLLEARSAARQRTEGGVSALLLAAQEGHLRVAQLLVEGFGVSVQDTNGSCSPLQSACAQGHAQVVQFLLWQRAQVEVQDGTESPLYIASGQGYLAVARLLVKEGHADVDRRHAGFTPLFVAAQLGHLAVCEFLVKSGADVNVVADDGASPLYIAARKAQREVVEYLLEARAEVNRARRNGSTPLRAALQAADMAVLRLLVDAGGRLNQVPRQFLTPCHPGDALLMRVAQSALQQVVQECEIRACVAALRSFFPERLAQLVGQYGMSSNFEQTLTQLLLLPLPIERSID
eukprot:g27067.t1